MGSSILGSRVLRTEDPRFVTGEARYTEDVPVEGALHAVFVRSFVAHGKLNAVDASQARSMPGVVSVFTANDLDLPKMWEFGSIPDEFGRPVLADGTVRFVGEPVAVVVAETRAQAMDAAESVLLDVDPLPAVVDAASAVEEGASLLFPDAGTNVAMRFDLGDDPTLFEDAEVVVKTHVVSQPLAPVPLEVNACAVAPDPESEGLTVWASIQDVFSMRDRIATSLTIDESRVRVIARNVGGGFGAKIDTYPEHVAIAAIAHRLGRPVRWIETRSESMTAMTLGRSRVCEIELGAKRDGTLTAVRANLIGDSGAYPGLDAGQSLLTFQMAQGPYRVPKLGFAISNVVTNTTPRAAYRGAGRPEATQFLEIAMDRLAAELGIDPVELRRKNLLRPDEFPHATSTGAEYDSGEYGKALDEALRLADHQAVRAEQRRRRDAGGAPLLGIGVSTYVEVTAVGPTNEFGSVSMDAGGNVTVTAGTGPTGQGHETALAQVAAAVLDVPFERIRVVVGDSGEVARGNGTYGSRSLQLGGTAVHRAGEHVVEKARRVAAHLLETAPDDVVLYDGRFSVTGAPDRAVTWEEVAAAAHDPARLPGDLEPGLDVSGTVDQRGTTYPFGAHVSVVEVDPETGRVRILKHVAVDDCGRILNPALVDGQVHGGLGQGIAQALYEDVVFDDGGNPLTANLTAYEFPAAPDLPSYVVSHTETPTSMNPLGAKGIGESATLGSTPAVQNAVVDALRPLGVTEVQLPLSPERVWRAIRDAKAGTRRDEPAVPDVDDRDAAATIGPGDAVGSEGLHGDEASPSGHGERTG
jgi:aerobic carbon-monoxide dehydrogenase large subunit